MATEQPAQLLADARKRIRETRNLNYKHKTLRHVRFLAQAWHFRLSHIGPTQAIERTRLARWALYCIRPTETTGLNRREHERWLRGVIENSYAPRVYRGAASTDNGGRARMVVAWDVRAPKHNPRVLGCLLYRRRTEQSGAPWIVPAENVPGQQVQRDITKLVEVIGIAIAPYQVRAAIYENLPSGYAYYAHKVPPTEVIFRSMMLYMMARLQATDRDGVVVRGVMGPSDMSGRLGGRSYDDDARLTPPGEAASPSNVTTWLRAIRFRRLEAPFAPSPIVAGQRHSWWGRGFPYRRFVRANKRLHDYDAHLRRQLVEDTALWRTEALRRTVQGRARARSRRYCGGYHHAAKGALGAEIFSGGLPHGRGMTGWRIAITDAERRRCMRDTIASAIRRDAPTV